jgi:hypothetical protein
VHPTLIPEKRLIANVEGVMNAVLVKGDAVGPTLYYGAGAGAEPTASAVIADLVDVTRMHTADPGHRVPHLAFQPDQLSDLPFLPMGEVETSYYLRMRVEDKPGVLADITRILADREISIDAMIQKEPSEGEEQTDIILLTHRASRAPGRRAIAEIEALATVQGQGRAHPARSAQLASARNALHLDARARGPSPAAVLGDPDRRPRPTAGSRCRSAIRAFRARARRAARRRRSHHVLRISRSRACRASCRHSRADLKR